MRVRSIAEAGPWCWQEKEARRLIRKALNGAPMTAYALGVYDALTENASDRTSDTFETFHPHLAMLAGCSVAQLKRALKLLVEFGIVRIETPKLRGACTFTLLALSDTTMAPIEPALALSEKRGSRATTEESVEEQSEEQLKLVNPAKPVAPAARNVCDADLLKQIAASPAYAHLNVPIEFEKCRIWCSVSGKLFGRRRFINWLNRIQKPMGTAASAPVADKKPWQLEAEAMVQAVQNDTATQATVIACRDAILAGGQAAINWLNCKLDPNDFSSLLNLWKVNSRGEPLP